MDVSFASSGSSLLSRRSSQSRTLIPSSTVRTALLCRLKAAAKDSASTGCQAFDLDWLAKQSAVMAASSAVLGPFCDGQHSSRNVLHYAHPSLLNLGSLYQLETCWWVPLLFAAAGMILGVSHPYLDQQPWAIKPRGGTNPSWAWVLASIAFFVAQYGASGALEAPLLGHTVASLPAIDVVLSATGTAHWWWFDGTRQGLIMALLTAACGPLVEIALINVGHLYDYTHPQLWGIPSWIPWVYLCGSAAVGNLGRKVSASMLSNK